MLEVPDGWHRVSLGDVLSIHHGKRQNEVEDPMGEYPILASGGQIGLAKKFLYDKPSVLIGRKGTIDRPQYMDRPFWTVDTLFYSSIKEPNYPKFLFYLFCTINWRRYNEASGVPSLNANTIEGIEVIIPKYRNEQNRITEILSIIDETIQHTIVTIRKLKNMKNGLIHDLMSGVAYPRDNWVQATVSDIVDPQRKITYGVVQPGPRQDSGIPIIRGQDYSSGEVSTEGLYRILPSIASAYQRSTVKGGDLLLSIVGYVGQTAQVPDELTGANLTQTTARIAIRDGFCPRYFLHYFRSPEFKEEVRRYTKGSAQPGLNLSNVEKFCVWYPEYDVQKEISVILDDYDWQIRGEVVLCATLNSIKKGLLDDLLSGKVRVPESMGVSA